MSAPAPRPPSDRRLAILNWLAFLAVLGAALAEGVAVWDARRRRARAAAPGRPPGGVR